MTSTHLPSIRGLIQQVVTELRVWAPIPGLEFSVEQNEVTHGGGQTMNKLMGNMMARVIAKSKQGGCRGRRAMLGRGV